MKKLFLLLFALATLPVFAQQRYDLTIMVDGAPRQFIVALPGGAPPAAGYPMVVMFHGTSGDGERFYNISGWKEKGEAETFVSVFPSSLEYCVIDSGRQRRTTKWNNGDLVDNGCPGQTYKDDVRFIRQMIDSIRNRLPIDPTRIYASGFSNGGLFSSKLAVEMSDVFAAVTVAAGSLHELDSAEPKRNIPIAYIIGDQDRNVAEAGGPEVLPFNDSTLHYFRWMINRYLATFDLAPTWTRNDTPLSLTWLYNTPSGSSSATGFSFTLIRNMPHIYPNGTNHPVSAANAFWQFFERFTLTSRAPIDRIDVAGVTIYPNPATSQIRIEGVDARSILLRDLLGQPVLEKEMNGAGTVALAGVRPGFYLLEIVTSKGIVSRKLVVE